MKKKVISTLTVICMAVFITVMAIMHPKFVSVRSQKTLETEKSSENAEYQKDTEISANTEYEGNEISVFTGNWYQETSEEAENTTEREEKEENGFLYCLYDNERVTVHGYTGDEKDIIIPEAFQGKPVTNVDTQSLLNFPVESVTIPQSVERVYVSTPFADSSMSVKNIYVSEDNPFFSSENGILYNKDKTRLICCPTGKQGVIDNLPDSLTKIGEHGFQFCKKLEKVILPKQIKTIESYAFCESSIDEIVLPENLEKIKENVFVNCWNLKNIYIPAKVSSIGIDVFFGCHSLEEISVSDKNAFFVSQDGILYNKEMTNLIQCPAGRQGELMHLPDTLITIGIDAFLGCGVTKVNLPEGLSVIEDGAFKGSSITEIIIPDAVTAVKSEAFMYCNLEEVKLPKSLKRIGNYAFCGCGLSNIELPQGLYAIGYSAFDGCDTSFMKLPESLRIMDGKALSQSSGYIYQKDENVHIKEEDFLYFINDDKETVTVTNYTGYELDVAIPDNIQGMPVTDIDFTDFAQEWLMSISIPKSIQHMEGWDDLTYDSNIEHIEIDSENPVFSSENGIVYNKDKTMLIFCPKGKQGELCNLPDSLETVGKYAFYCCGKITSVKLPHGVYYIGESAFERCSKMTEVSFPSSLKRIEQNGFYDCTCLEHVLFPEGINKEEKISIGSGNDCLK